MIGARGRTTIVNINEPTRVGEARRRASALAGDLGFDETERGRVSLVVTEAASNLLKHAGGGELIVQGRGGDRAGDWLEILALDRGAGMSDVGRCLTDGYSTAGSLGTGLGAIARLSDDHGIYSRPGVGTAVWARLDSGPAVREAAGVVSSLAAVSVPAPGEIECGDDWAIELGRGRSLIMVVDGLGHGPAAADAARAALGVFRARPAEGPVGLIEAAHGALRGTRGAAMAIAQVDPGLGRVEYAGVGNICGVIIDGRDGRTTSMVSHVGTVGHVVRKIQAFQYAWSPDSLLVMHSDGVATRWDLTRYLGLLRREPALIAGILYRDFRRGRDDATVLVLREGGAPP